MIKTITKWQRFLKILNTVLTVIGTTGLVGMVLSVFLAIIFPQVIIGFIFSIIPALFLFFVDVDV